jgi:hypothetical protein
MVFMLTSSLVVWAADFNYRIAMSNEEVRPLAESGHIDPLLAADQLMQAIDEGEVFQDYTEGAIAFLPTYKLYVLLSPLHSPSSLSGSSARITNNDWTS